MRRARALLDYAKQLLARGPSDDDVAEFCRGIKNALPAAPRTDGPLVSVVIPNHNGEDHLRTCMEGLNGTAYNNFEVIVVDNASTDQSRAYLEAITPNYPLRVIKNPVNATFSEASNQGAKVGGGEFYLFLNNDVEPLDAGWLGWMVDTMIGENADAVGARLIYPRPNSRQGRIKPLHPALSLQHAGIHFVGGEAVPRARNLGTGQPADSGGGRGPREAAAVTAACMLVRGSAFRRADGFSHEYIYGTEDVDLCLKLRAQGGRIVQEDRAVLWHHEFGTQSKVQRSVTRENRLRNRAAFVSAWGPRIYREALTDRLKAKGLWSDQKLHVGISVTRDDPTAGFGDWYTAHELGEALTELGWQVSYLESEGDRWYNQDASIDIVVSLLNEFDVGRAPPHAVTVAWISDGTDQWISQPSFNDYDIVLVSSSQSKTDVESRTTKVASIFPLATNPVRSHRAVQLREILRSWCEAQRFGIHIEVPRHHEIDQRGGDHHARSVARELERLNRPTRVSLLDEWPSENTAVPDVALHLFGNPQRKTRRGQINILWAISHPELITPDMCGDYDVVLVASAPFARELASQTSAPVIALHHATDPERFQRRPGGQQHDLLFVGNSRKINRKIIDDLAGTSHDLAIYGSDWTPDLVAQRHVKGNHIPVAGLAEYYSAASIVLNDHLPDMRRMGIFSNRLYDALACGAFVISDHVEGIADEFDDGLVTYNTRDELQELIDHYLRNPAERARVAERGYRAVLARHTFRQRVAKLVEIADPLVKERGLWIDGSSITS